MQYKNNNKETFDEKKLITPTDYFIFFSELFGILLGLIFIMNCKRNLLYNLVLYIFCPWLFVILHCYSNTCGNSINCICS